MTASRIGYFLRYAFVMLAAFPSSGQVTLTSSNLPIVVITTQQEIVDDPKVPGQMGIIDNGVGVRNNVTDPFNNFNGKIGIEIRGSSSQTFPKKQYGIELQDANGNGIDASLLGMPKKDDWVLFAPYNDKSLMRDVLAYKLGRDMGDYASRSRYCEVILNGAYQGVYVMLEKVKRDRNRVNIDKLDPIETTGDNLTGGYILKLDKTTGSESTDIGWVSSFNPENRSGFQTVMFQYEYPKGSDIVAEQKGYIKNYVDSFEGVLAGANFKDPANGYAHFIDVPSFVDFFLANELTKNPDAYRLSTFLYKKKDSDGGKISMGPIWDFNLGFGNVNYCTNGNPEGWVVDFNSVCPTDYWLIPFWWGRLFEDDAFRQQTASRWTTLRQGPLKTQAILNYIDSVAVVLQESQQRNFITWPVLGVEIWPNYYVGKSFSDEVTWLKNWISARLSWMDVNLPDIVTGTREPATFSAKGFPNPFYRDFEIELITDRPGAVTIDLFDVLGMRIEHVERSSDGNARIVVRLDTSGLSPGTYLFQARLGGQVITQKAIKKP